MRETTAIPAATTFMMEAADGCQAWVEACASWQQELARFTDRRLAENRRTWNAFVSSRDITGVMKAQQDWVTQAATDYTEEATRLTRLMTTLSLTGTTPDVQETAAINA
jgi:signal-transduction protein with cAMP-binding, CBS, and nucleotidyltransferase domain